MKLVITYNLVNTDTLAEAAQSDWAKNLVDMVRAQLNDNTIIEESIAFANERGLNIPKVEAGRRSVAVESDSPVIYSVRE